MRKTNAPSQPFGRLIAACGILLAVVLVSALMTTFLQKPNLDALADNAATAAPEIDPTPTPEPTITPTPAVYAPFGAQYGYGGANLIPETPTPDPVSVTPTPKTARRCSMPRAGGALRRARRWAMWKRGSTRRFSSAATNRTSSTSM